MPQGSDSFATLEGTEVALLSSAVALAEPRDAVFRAIDRIAQTRMAVNVFSASVCFVESLELERVYSSRPEVYELGARKSKRGTRWAQQVLVERQLFVGEGPLEMAAAFDDQERMESVGIRSIINVPIVVADRCLGVLNFGRGVERVLPAHVILARWLGVAAGVAFLAETPRR
jgi:GAF domain-containing protein